MMQKGKEGVFHLKTDQVMSLLDRGMVTISTIGLGRIGLPTAAMFANGGAKIIGVDIDPSIVVEVNEGKCRFVDEPSLSKIIADAVKNGFLRATTSYEDAIPQSDFIVVCVPTPVDEAKVPDYTSVLESCRTVGKLLQPGSIVIIESTVGPGTVENLIEPILEKESGMKAGSDFGLASAPERSDPGNIISNMKTVPRVVGAVTQHCLDIVSSLYEKTLKVKVFRASNPKTANAIKLTENLFRDVNIALANEFAILFEKLGIDAIEVVNGCSGKYNFMPHYPGAGVGGPCLPSNSYYLIVEGIKSGNIPYLVRMAREINDRMPDHVVELVSEALNEASKTVRGSKIAILGIAYKPGIKDVQLTPIERVASSLAQMGAVIDVYDPMFAGESVLGYNVRRNLEQAVKNADCVVIGTAHKEFRDLQLEKLGELVHRPAALVDARNVLDPQKALTAGFSFRGVGRKFEPTSNNGN